MNAPIYFFCSGQLNQTKKRHAKKQASQQTFGPSCFVRALEVHCQKNFRAKCSFNMISIAQCCSQSLLDRWIFVQAVLVYLKNTLPYLRAIQILYKYCMECQLLVHHSKNKHSLKIGHFLVHRSLQVLHLNCNLSLNHSHTHRSLN